jgi:hypothetical protein
MGLNIPFYQLQPCLCDVFGELAITFCHFGGAIELKKQTSSSLCLFNSFENYVAFKVGN